MLMSDIASPNEDYCKWCYADGTYTYSNMDDLINVCVVALLIWFRDELSDLTLDKILGRKTDNERDSEDNNKM